jgi:stress-induced morphogen
MSFVVSSREMPNSKKIKGICVKGDHYISGENVLILKGETFPHNITYEGLYEKITQHGLLRTVKGTEGEFVVIFYDGNLNKMYIASDRLGREPLFYFHDGTDFIVSDDFWEIVNIIEPAASDIDVQSLKEFIIFSNPLFYKTIIGNLNFFPPASIGGFSSVSKKFELKQYWDFRFKEDNALSIEDAVERTDRIFDLVMKQIRDKNDPNATYGVGLSGGLDSRLIPYYALKHNMHLTSFIIGEKKPHRLMLSNDHKHARKVAKYYGLDHHEVEYDSERFEDKSFYDIRYNPMSTSQFFKTARENLPCFDIYLNGTFGAIIGSIDYPSSVEDLSKGELLDMIVSLFSDINTIQTHRKLRLALKLMFRYNVHSTNRQSIDGIIGKEEFALGVNKIRQFIEDNSDKSNVNILYKYLINHLGAHSKYGAYESLLGWKKSYTYYPHLLNEMLNWNNDLLRNRCVLKSLLTKKFPELAKIKAQDLDVAPFYQDQNKRFNVLRKAFSLLEYILRGQGVIRASKWAKEKEYAEYTLKILSNETKIFRSIFDIEKVKKMRVQSPGIYDNLIKLKLMIDLIETKGYKKFNLIGTKGHSD